MKITLISSLKEKGECKFKEKCSLYANTSFTCTYTGGSYCGNYRKLDRNSTKSPKDVFAVVS